MTNQPPDGAEPDRAAEYERTRRERLHRSTVPTKRGQVTRFRLGVRDPRLGGATLWYDMDNPGDAHTAYQLLHDYGRDDVTATMECLDPDGHWLPVPVRTYPTRVAASGSSDEDDQFMDEQTVFAYDEGLLDP